MAFVGKKVYGQSKSEDCHFCGKQALSVNSQGFPTCHEHKTSVEEAKKCVCGSYMDVKTSKWGPFYLCPECGPQSKTKTENMESGGFKLNKSLRVKKEQADKKEIFKKRRSVTYQKEVIYTLDELESMWD